MLINESNLKQVKHVLIPRMKNVGQMTKVINKYNGLTCTYEFLISFLFTLNKHLLSTNI